MSASESNRFLEEVHRAVVGLDVVAADDVFDRARLMIWLSFYMEKPLPKVLDNGQCVDPAASIALSVCHLGIDRANQAIEGARRMVWDSCFPDGASLKPLSPVNLN